MNATNLKIIQTLFDEVKDAQQNFNINQEIIERDILLDKIKLYYNAIKKFERNKPLTIDNALLFKENLIQTTQSEEKVKIDVPEILIDHKTQNIEPQLNAIQESTKPIIESNLTQPESIQSMNNERASLSKLIDLNTRFGLIQNFFKGDIQAYQKAIEEFDGLNSKSDIINHLLALTNKQNIDINSELYEVFEKLIMRYSLKIESI